MSARSGCPLIIIILAVGSRRPLGLWTIVRPPVDYRQVTKEVEYEYTATRDGKNMRKITIYTYVCVGVKVILHLLNNFPIYHDTYQFHGLVVVHGRQEEEPLEVAMGERRESRTPRICSYLFLWF